MRGWQRRRKVAAQRNCGKSPNDSSNNLSRSREHKRSNDKYTCSNNLSSKHRNIRSSRNSKSSSCCCASNVNSSSRSSKSFDKWFLSDPY